MKTGKNKAAVVLMTAAMLLNAVLPTGCKSKETRIREELQSKTEEFIDVFTSGDADKMEDLVDGRFYYNISTAAKKDIMFKIASKTEVESYVSFDIDTKEGKAKIRTKLSYIDIFEFGRDKNNRNISAEECMANVDTYENRSTANFTFNFVRDDEGNWKIKDTTAERYEDLFNHQYLLSVVAISKDKAKENCLDIFSRLARGEFNQQIFTYDLNDVGAFNTWGRTTPVITDAMTEFAKAYFNYFVEHGLTVEETSNAYEYKITGYVPSKEGLMSYYSSEEYAIETDMAVIRAEITTDPDKQQAVWDSYIAGIYYDLAKMIPNLMGEEYSVTLKIVNKGNDVMIQAQNALCGITTDDIFAAPKYTYEQDKIARKKEYPNQAVNVKEETPEWSTDGKIIYGTSDPDKNGISMLYSKEPGWLNTAGYNISDNGITVLVKYDKKFAKGTELEFDWDINGSTQQYGVPFVVSEDGMDEFEFSIPAKLVSSGNTAEFRLWEKGHAHVIAYVKLTKT